MTPTEAIEQAVGLLVLVKITDEMPSETLTEIRRLLVIAKRSPVCQKNVTEAIAELDRLEKRLS